MRIPLGYRLVRALARALARVFYGRLDVVGLEHVPARGPLIVVANHQNALVDPMLLLATLPRRLAPIAKAPLFHSPFAPLPSPHCSRPACSRSRGASGGSACVVTPPRSCGSCAIGISTADCSRAAALSPRRWIVLYIVVQVSALLGALAQAGPTDRLGPRRVVMITLCQWSVIVIAAYWVQTPAQFYVVAVIAGTGLGAIQAASRTLLTTLIPTGKEAEMFGFYTLCGKSAAIMGPLVFGSISHAAGGNQRLGILAIGSFFVIGLVLLSRMRGAEPTGAGAARRSARART